MGIEYCCENGKDYRPRSGSDGALKTLYSVSHLKGKIADPELQRLMESTYITE
jgi:hypothetical protein